MFKSARRIDLEAKESELWILKQEILEIKQWVAHLSPEIAFAMLRLEDCVDSSKGIDSIDKFRLKLNQGVFTFNNYTNLEKRNAK